LKQVINVDTMSLGEHGHDAAIGDLTGTLHIGHCDYKRARVIGDLMRALFIEKAEHIVIGYELFCDPTTMRILDSITPENTNMRSLKCYNGNEFGPTDEEEQAYWVVIGRVIARVTSITLAEFDIGRSHPDQLPIFKPEDSPEHPMFVTLVRLLETRPRLDTIVVYGASLLDFAPLLHSRKACPRELCCFDLREYDNGDLDKCVALNAIRNSWVLHALTLGSDVSDMATFAVLVEEHLARNRALSWPTQIAALVNILLPLLPMLSTPWVLLWIIDLIPPYNSLFPRDVSAAEQFDPFGRRKLKLIDDVCASYRRLKGS
jgi:hypothetical protein